MGGRVKRFSLRIAHRSPSIARSKRTIRRPSRSSVEKPTGAGQASTSWARSPRRVASTRIASACTTAACTTIGAGNAAAVARSSNRPARPRVLTARPPGSRKRRDQRVAPSIADGCPKIPLTHHSRYRQVRNGRPAARVPPGRGVLRPPARAPARVPSRRHTRRRRAPAPDRRIRGCRIRLGRLPRTCAKASSAGRTLFRERGLAGREQQIRHGEDEPVPRLSTTMSPRSLSAASVACRTAAR